MTHSPVMTSATEDSLLLLWLRVFKITVLGCIALRTAVFVCNQLQFGEAVVPPPERLDWMVIASWTIYLGLSVTCWQVERARAERSVITSLVLLPVTLLLFLDVV